MKPVLQLSRTLLLLVAVVPWLAACAGSPPTRYYTLNPLAAPETKLRAENPARPVSIGILPVQLPDYLDTPHIVTRDGMTRLKFAEFDRWAGSLSDNISTVLAENLSLLRRTDHILVDPGHPEKVNYSVAMRVLRLDCLPGRHVLLKVQWTVFAGPEYKEIATHSRSFTEKLYDSSYDTMAEAVSKTLEQVSREIAQEIPAR